ncbi:hypothetical protein [Polynucleobacter sp. AP-Ainpum-60-G11]|uniref:hypothetical protein n=1 Tax=Polynucleobacter sp. AP-Ainpum-60-G11 TaxID=2576926 RepID=UPI001BFD943D|nr:hypothetical protein [Polynucleobacter sp. AP-Ainpum-60-G11]QWE27501.1 hypothetical protein FD971_04335 [Polynucleobacter sp. AP-Ainpum-60-G11]
MANTSNKVVNPQTGPKTALGKSISSKNAQKASIFVRGYLPSENPEQRQAQFELLCEQWGASDPTRQILLRTVEEANLGCERLMLALRQKIEGKMQSLEIAQEFAKQAGMSALDGLSLPSWFFKENSSQKSHATKLLNAYSDVLVLRDCFSDQLTAQIAQQFPNLYAYVMEGQRQGMIFSSVLGQRYRQATPLLNYAAVQKEIEEKYRHHLTWAQDADRYEAIIAGIRASQMIEAMELDKYTRYMTSFQNRIFKGIHGLAVIDQYEAKTVQTLPNGISLSESGDAGAEVTEESD